MLVEGGCTGLLQGFLLRSQGGWLPTRKSGLTLPGGLLCLDSGTFFRPHHGTDHASCPRREVGGGNGLERYRGSFACGVGRKDGLYAGFGGAFFLGWSWFRFAFAGDDSVAATHYAAGEQADSSLPPNVRHEVFALDDVLPCLFLCGLRHLLQHPLSDKTLAGAPYDAARLGSEFPTSYGTGNGCLNITAKADLRSQSPRAAGNQCCPRAGGNRRDYVIRPFLTLLSCLLGETTGLLRSFRGRHAP